MTLKKHLDDAAERIEQAAARIRAVRAEPASQEAMVEWLAALTDYVTALAESHSYANESIHEKLQDLARRTKAAPAVTPKH
jgi:hypothetical protein